MTSQHRWPLVLLVTSCSGATSDETSVWRESAARSIPPRRAGQSHMNTLRLGGDEEMPVAPYLPLKRGGRRARPFGRARRVGINARPRRSPPGAQERHSRCFASAFLAAKTAAEGRLCLPFSRGGMEQVAHELRNFRGRVVHQPNAIALPYRGGMGQPAHRRIAIHLRGCGVTQDVRQ
jgi:hypothetical protein